MVLRGFSWSFHSRYVYTFWRKLQKRLTLARSRVNETFMCHVEHYKQRWSAAFIASYNNYTRFEVAAKTDDDKDDEWLKRSEPKTTTAFYRVLSCARTITQSVSKCTMLFFCSSSRNDRFLTHCQADAIFFLRLFDKTECMLCDGYRMNTVTIVKLIRNRRLSLSFAKCISL